MASLSVCSRRITYQLNSYRSPTGHGNRKLTFLASRRLLGCLLAGQGLPRLWPDGTIDGQPVCALEGPHGCVGFAPPEAAVDL